ncbi:MAG: hypothetical protein K2P33_04295 [Acutalibacter sp.]|nr:hypothetical protein [Acutalibacter sp.]
MAGAMILVSGMCGTGKSAFAQWLGERLELPAVHYHRLLRRVKELDPQAAKGGELAYQLFLFELEEHMGCAFIADYIFSARQEDWLRELTEAHGCKTVNIHFDCEPSTACARYTRRNQEDAAPTRPEVSFDLFQQAVRQSRAFLWGGELIPVNTEDFGQVSYPEILEKVERVLYPQNRPRGEGLCLTD